MNDRVLSFTPPETIARFMNCDDPVRLVSGPVGSGKSTGCMMDIVRHCSTIPHSKDGYRRSRWAVVRNTRPQLKTTTLKTWLSWLPDGVYGYWRESDMTYFLEFGDVRAEILFIPLDDANDERKLLSLELTGAYVNEARELPFEIIAALRSRLGRYPSKAMCKEDYWHGLIMDTNPPSKDHWIYEKFEVERPRGYTIFKQPSGLAPNAENRENLPPTYYEDMMEGQTADWIEAHVHGRYSRSLLGCAVFEKTFNEEHHVAKAPLRLIRHISAPILIGMDFGRDPSAIIGQRNPRSQLILLGEVLMNNCGLERFLRDHLKPWLNERAFGHPVQVVGDPAGWAKSQINDLSCADILRQEGFQCVPAPTNDPNRRIEAVERFLTRTVDGDPSILFDPGMKVLIGAMNRDYRYKTRKDGTREPSPEKNFASHPSDALQYLCLGADNGGGASLVRARPEARKIVPASAGGWM